MANTIGTAYINIAPNMTGIQGKIAGGLSGSGSMFADQFGGEISGRSAVIIGAIAGVAQAGVQKAMSMVTGSISAAISRVDTLNNAQRTFQYMGFAASDSATAVKDVTKSIQGLPTPLDGAIRGMTALAATYGNVQLGQKMFTSLNDAVLGFGGSAAMVDNAIQQISQLPLDGPLDAQTWNSLRNSGLTPVLVAMGKDMGLSVSEMKSQFGSGQLKVQDFVNELNKMDKSGGGGLVALNEIAHNATSGIGTGFANMQTAVTRGVAAIIQAVGSKNISDAIAEIGKVFETALKLIATYIPIVVADIKTFFDYVNKNKDIFYPIAAGIGAIVLAITAWKTALFVWSEVTKIATGIQAAFNIVMDANPITLIALAIIGLVAGLVYFFTQTSLGKKVWSEFLGFLTGIWDGIKTGFAAVGSFFTGIWDGIKSGLSTVGNFFKGIWDSISNAVSSFLKFFSEHWRIIILIVLGPLGLLIDFVTAYWSEITGAISTAVNAVADVITTVFTAIAGFFSYIWGEITGAISTAVNFVWGVISSVFSAIAGFMSAVFGPPINAVIGAFQWLGGVIGSIASGIWGGITTAFNAVTGFLGGVGSTIGRIFAGAGSWLFDAGKDLINGLINGAQSLLSKIGEMFLNVIPGWIKDPFKKALGIHSPSTVFAEYGGNITDGLVNGISANATNVTDAVGALADSAIAGMSSSNLSAQFGTQVAGTSINGNVAVASTPGAAQGGDSPAVVQNNNIYNQVDLNSVTRELAWQIRR